MPRIKIDPHDFVAPYQNIMLTQSINVSWSELIWAAVTVGRANFNHVIRHGVFSRYEMQYRIAMLFANLQENMQGDIIKSSAYHSLDPSEKSAVSYFLGMTLSKLIAQRLFNVPWLMHLDVYRHLYNFNALGRSKPDLFGPNINGEWIVLEAKGRTNLLCKTTLNKAKEQAELLYSINGNDPILNIGGQVSFSNDILTYHMIDPKPNKERGFAIEISKEEYISDYYRPFNELISYEKYIKVKTFRNQEYRFSEFLDFDINIGVVGVHSDKINEVVEEGSIFIGLDNILIESGESWSTYNMQKEPQKRLEERDISKK